MCSLCQKKKERESKAEAWSRRCHCVVSLFCSLYEVAAFFLGIAKHSFLSMHVSCTSHKQNKFTLLARQTKQSNAQAQPALYLLPMFSDSAASSMCKIKHRFKYLSPSCLLAFHVILGFFYSWDFHSLHSKRGRKKKLNLWRKLRLSSISRFIWRSRGKKDF